VIPYDPAWPVLFAGERDALLASLSAGSPPTAAQIEHIGSTSVPELAAKPILDLLVGIPDHGDLAVLPDAGVGLVAPYVAAFASVGYEYRGEHGLPGRHFFTKGELRTHHLHMVGRDSDAWRTHLLFRDHLRRDLDAARAYEALKRGLAERYADDREAYADGKVEFIEARLRAATAAQARAR